MRVLRKPPLFTSLFPFLLGFFLVGCSPSEESGEGAVSPPQPTPTPAATPFIFHTDAEEAHYLVLKPYIEKVVRLPETHTLRWSRSEKPPENWDAALVRTWNMEEIESNSIDLLADLEAAYPRHGADFFIPVKSLLTTEGRLLSLPAALIPDFLFARNRPGWSLRFDPEAFRTETARGARIGLVKNPAGESVRSRLEIPEDQVEWIQFSDPNNPFFSGEIDFAIGPKGWLMERQIQGLAAVSILQLGVFDSAPDSGYRFAVSQTCPIPEVGREILKDLVTEGQSAMVGVADAFPIRRSVYSSPRMQAPQFALFRSAFEETLNGLAPRFPKD